MAISDKEGIVYQAREAYLDPDGASNMGSLNGLLDGRGAWLYERTGEGTTNKIGIHWDTFDEDLVVFEEVIRLILESVDLLVMSDREFRITAIPELISILENNSPLFKILADTYSKRPESTLEHIKIVSRMIATDGLLAEEVLLARVQALFHDIGKVLIIDDSTKNSEGRLVRRLSNDRSHHHAQLSALMLEELLMGLEDDLKYVLSIGNNHETAMFSQSVRLHHGLEAVAVGYLTPQEMAVLLKSVPNSVANSVILMLADMGAAGNLDFLTENLNALFKILEEFDKSDIDNEFGSQQELENILTNALARIIYEMKHEDWVSLGSSDDEMVVQKIISVMTNISTLLSNAEVLADDSRSKENLLAIISRAAIVIAGKIEASLNMRKEMIEASLKPQVEQIIQFFHEIIESIAEKFSFVILAEMQKEV